MYMVVLNTIMGILSAAAILSVRWMRTPFSRLEQLIYYMVIVVAIEQTHSAIVNNMQLIRWTNDFSTYFFYKMNILIAYPILTLWLMQLLWQPRPRVMLKLLASAVWMGTLCLSYLWFQHLGIFQFNGWNLGYAIPIWFVVLLESMLFIALFRKLLERGELHDPLPS